MSMQSLRDNIKKLRNLSKEASYFNDYLTQKLSSIPERREYEKDLLNKTIDSLINQVEIINFSIPEIVNNISPSPKLPQKTEKLSAPAESGTKAKNLVKIEYELKESPETVTLRREDKERFIRELNISSDLIKKLKKRAGKKPVGGGWTLHKPNFYGRISNFFFRSLSRKLIDRGHFHKLNSRLRKSNSSFIVNTYVSILFFTQVLVFLLSIIGVIVLISSGIFSSDNLGVIEGIGIIAGLQLLVWAIIYLSPSMEVSSTARKINQELPFVTVHMAAIAGSGIEPSRIFSIIASNNDYPNTRKELIKVINQINYYGYDLVNALRNVAKTTSSEKLAELFKGLAVTISSGGSLEQFLSKRAETLILDYRLEREKYSKIAENFMNIYIALVIAAPMIFLLLLILIGISGTGLNYTPAQLSVMMISAVSLINIIFLFLLRMKQPVY